MWYQSNLYQKLKENLYKTKQKTIACGLSYVDKRVATTMTSEGGPGNPFRILMPFTCLYGCPTTCHKGPSPHRVP